MFTDDEASESQASGPSREEIEALCVIHAVGTDGISVDELPGRLGIARAHAKALSDAIEPLVTRGWIERDDERICVTEQGNEWAETRLEELGIG